MSQESAPADRKIIEKLADRARKSVPEMIETLKANPSRSRLRRSDALRDIPDDLVESFALLADSHGMKPVDLLRQLVENEKSVVKE